MKSKRNGVPDGIGQTVSANAANLAYTTDRITDRIIENLEKQVLDLARLVVDMEKVLDGATVIDRATERRLRELFPRVDVAYDILHRAGERA